MNIALEIHDSTLDELKKDSASAVLRLSKAIIHRSEKEPGVDIGTCWIQSIDIRFENVHILNEPEDIPTQLDYGYFIINGKKHTNVVGIPLNESGNIEAMFKTFYGNELKIVSDKIIITEVGEAQYLQDFE